MTSWADVAEVVPKRQTVQQAAVVTQTHETWAVLDANAIIGRSVLQPLADRSVSTAEVLAECRDRATQDSLAALPYEIAVQEPGEESIQQGLPLLTGSSHAVTRFARLTGELHSLSIADVRLIALAHTLELAAGGAARLHTDPAAPRALAKKMPDGRRLPGWGDTGEEWAELDAMDEEELRAAEATLQGDGDASRISSQVGNLSLEDAEPMPDTSDAGGSDINSNATEEGAGAWEVAAKSHNAARRHRKREAQSKLHGTAEDNGHAGPLQRPDSTPPEQEGGGMDEPGSSEALSNGGDATDVANDDGAIDDGARPVVIVTGDFAMQNVILQMGLCLAAPDGRRIGRLSRWVLRCSACFKVTKEVERLFCPQCGNAALEKVEMAVGEGGAEQYGVRRKHVIRGTRFSLPKPKGGKNSRDPVLREDVLLARMPRRKPKPAADVFVPEYTAETWHGRATGAPGLEKGLANALASWKHNPNERQMTRTNRRK